MDYFHYGLLVKTVIQKLLSYFSSMEQKSIQKTKYVYIDNEHKSYAKMALSSGPSQLWCFMLKDEGLVHIYTFSVSQTQQIIYVDGINLIFHALYCAA